MRTCATPLSQRPTARSVNVMITKQVSIVAPGMRLARVLRAMAMSKGDATGAAKIAENDRDTPEVGVALARKAAVPAMTTTSTSPLDDLGISADARLPLSKVCAFDQAQSRGMRRVPVATGVPREIDAGTVSAWVRQGHAIPPVKFMFDLLRLHAAILGTLVVLTLEVWRTSDAVIRDAAIVAMARGTDTAFLDPTSAGDEAEGLPPAITFGAPHVDSVGILGLGEDLATVLNLVTTAGTGLTWIATPQTFASVAAALGAASDLPRSLLGLPVIYAPYAPARQLTLVDLPEVAFVDTSIDVEASQSATVQMENRPSNASANDGSPAGPTPTTLVSLYQTNSVGVKALRFVNWAVRSGSVAYLTLPAGSPS